MADGQHGGGIVAAVLAAKQWGARVLQQTTRVGFASPWAQTAGRPYVRGGRVLAAESTLEELEAEFEPLTKFMKFMKKLENLTRPL